MAETIGKYRLLELIGRGGMGTIYKAHDPILDRLVALKVISRDVELNDELRMRFFREAQACARLSHPNIVTVFDMGELDGRLFIVMEFLEGQELKRLIAQRTVMPLEQKISLILQVCDGLYYAHQKGIVHRDIKPANIMLLRNGQVKILDFGIAHIANTESGLTRTGLIMGTLRYIAPEQVRGRADHRSDMFSVGAVFYEFLSLRPPFIGDDPMQILEQLRTEDPPPLVGIDSTIPPALSAIVERAMRKDPEDRFADLHQLRLQLEHVQQELVTEAARVRSQIRARRDQLMQLQAALAERIGPSPVEEAALEIEPSKSLAALQGLERHLATMIEAKQAQIARAELVAGALERGTELLQAGYFADAVVEFESVVAEMPEHARAAERLTEARAGVEAERRRQLTARLLQDAYQALDEGAYGLCLEVLKQAAEIAAPSDVPREIAAMRETAEAALARQEAERRARRHAERWREQTARARAAAQAEADPEYALPLWNSAQERAVEAQDAFARGAYVEAGKAFEAAATEYRHFKDAAREAQRREREAAEQARTDVAHGRERARAQGAADYARELWNEAEAKLIEGTASFDEKAFAKAAAIYKEAANLYSRAEQAAHEAVQRERRRAGEARQQMARARRAAQEQTTPEYAPDLWNGAEARASEGEACFARAAYADAKQAFEAAAVGYQRFKEAAREAQRLERETAERVRETAAQSRERARAANAERYARELWDSGEAQYNVGHGAFQENSLGHAAAVLSESVSLYDRATVIAVDARSQEHQRAERAREQMTEAQRTAQEQAPPEYAPDLWNGADARTTEAEGAFAREAYGEACQAFEAATVAYRRFQDAASEAQRRDREEIARAQVEAVESQGRARAEGTVHYAQDLWDAAEAKLMEAQRSIDQKVLGRAAALFSEAAAAYGRASEAALRLRQLECQSAEAARDRAVHGQRAAEAVEAQQRASGPWREATSILAGAESAFARQEYMRAAETFDAASTLFRQAEDQALEARRLQQAQAEQARQGMEEHRRRATAVDAASRAESEWNDGEANAASGEAAFARGDYVEASQAFEQGSVLYARAEERAREVTRALETTRVGAEKSRETAAQARGAAAQAKAAKYAPEQWQAGHDSDELAGAALGRLDYAAARSLFVQARRHYTAAVQLAAVAAEAESRRADAMVGEARRLIDTGEFAASLPRLNDVLALRPDHQGAESLRREVERKLREVEARSLEVGQELASSDTTWLSDLDLTKRREDGAAIADQPGSSPKVIEAAVTGDATVVVQSPTSAGAGQSGSDMTMMSEPVAPVVEAQVDSADRTAVFGLPTPADDTLRPEVAAPTRADRDRNQVWKKPVKVPSVPSEKNSYSRPRTVAVAVAGLLAMLVVLYYSHPWGPQSSPSPPPGTRGQQQPAVPESSPLKVAPSQGVLETLRREASAARSEAEQAAAERLAAVAFSAATDKLRAAEAAEQRQDIETAQQRYREAQQAYAAAAAEARSAAAQGLQEEAGARASEARAAEARRAAQQADARKLARSLWAKAESAERVATDALKGRSYSRAQTFFGEAEVAYRDAERAASAVRAAEKAAAEKAAADKAAREKVAAAKAAENKAASEKAAADKAAAEKAAAEKAAAEKAAADRAAAENAAAEKAAADRTAAEKAAAEKATAARAAADKAAADKARQVALQQEMLSFKSNAEQAQNRMANRREQAVKAEAERFAKDIFGSAQTKQTEADGLMSRQSFALASHAYVDAGDRYMEAAIQAQQVRRDKSDADDAKKRMEAEKGRANTAAPEFGEGLAEEKLANSLYQQLSYKGAVDKFRAAETFFLKAKHQQPTKKPAPQSPSDKVKPRPWSQPPSF